MLNSGLAVTDLEAPLCRVLIEPCTDPVREAAKLPHHAPHGGLADARELRENWNRAVELVADLLITCYLPSPCYGVSAPVFRKEVIDITAFMVMPVEYDSHAACRRIRMSAHAKDAFQYAHICVVGKVVLLLDS
jgi:hypothetical protein